MPNKSLEQLKAEQLYYEAMAEHGFDPNAKVWVCNLKAASIGKMPNPSNDMQKAKDVINAIKDMECFCKASPQEHSFNKVIVGKQQCYKCKQWNPIYG